LPLLASVEPAPTSSRGRSAMLASLADFSQLYPHSFVPSHFRPSPPQL